MSTNIKQRSEIPDEYKWDIEDMYASDIQIAELNALAASLSIIRWKKMIGFYADITHEYFSVFGLNDNIIENEAETV